jgi:hypothetical protein
MSAIRRHTFKKSHRAGETQMSRATGCVFNRIISEGDAEDRAAVTALITSPKTHIAVAREMTSAGIYMSEHTVRRHRKADCSCAMVAA